VNKTKTQINKMRIGVVARPLARIENAPLTRFLKVLSYLSEDILVITGKNNIPLDAGLSNVSIEELEYAPSGESYNKVIAFVKTDLEIFIKMLKFSRSVDVWYFFTGGDTALPMIAAKITGKKIVMVLAASAVENVKVLKNQLYEIIVKGFSNLAASFSDYIVVYSPMFITKWNLEKYRNKILIAHEHHFDFSKFTITVSISDRENIIGYVGRLSHEKGIENLIHALPAILNKDPSLKVIVIGDGPLRESIKNFIIEKNLERSVKMIGWVKNEQLPLYLNQMKLLILPSFTEALPNVILEAMACGTPVLVTRVGALPDIIENNKNGFILDNNSSDQIAEVCLLAIKFRNLDSIVNTARIYVVDNYNLDNAVDLFRNVQEKVKNNPEIR
jgi:glycosyltransferase involved in cell wall biosynthesis